MDAIEKEKRWALANTRSCKQITNMYTLQKRRHSDVDEMGELVVSWQWGWMCRWSSRCATVHWVTAPGKIALRAQSLHHLAYCTAPWYLHCLTCTRFYTWYRHTLPPAAFYLSFSFTHFDVKLLCFLFFGSRFGHNLWHFILASIKILISTFRQHSTP